MYDEKFDGYFRNVRKELLDLIPKENRNGTMLEIGAGDGSTLLYAKKHGYAGKIYGVELCRFDNSNQESKEFEEFIIGDAEKIEFPFEEMFFDVILCGDVLEHMIDPYSMVNTLRGLLKHNGVIIASIPNIRQYRVILKILLEGDFRYEEFGILDRTHLRFFCKKNIIDLFESADMHIDKAISNCNLIGNTTKKINYFTFNIFDEFMASQYYIIARKK
jgi:SAM-dependent methyltransferase